MAVDVGGLIAVIVFYIVILVIGLIAARKSGLGMKNLKLDDVMLANRSIGVFVGCFTMTATWVGGGYINGTSEIVANSGLVWCQAPLGFAISLVFGGYFFAGKMRSSGFTTMLDPFHWKFGRVMNCLLYFPALTGDVFWSGSILAALGSTIKVILDIDLNTAIIISAGISLLYTLLGGLYSVAYTDVIQLIFMFIGLWLCVPFSMTHEATVSITANNSELWLGELTPDWVANYMDFWLLLICGGIPWQVYWQRALSSKTVRVAQLLSYLGAFGCVFMSVPAILMGAVAASTNWTMTDYGHPTIQASDSSLTLSLVMKHLCPTAVSFIGLGAVSAAVMSSTDSALLSSSTMFAKNVYGVIYASVMHKKPSETMIVWVMRIAQVVIAVLSCVTAIQVNSIYALFLLCSDLVYVLLFPQLVCVMYMQKANSYGSMAAFIIGLILRILGGEPGIDLPAVIEFPWFDGTTQKFPFRTLAMLVSMFTLIIVSYITDFLFRSGTLPLNLDFYSCFQPMSKDTSTKQADYAITSPNSTSNYDSTSHPDGLKKRELATADSATKL